MGYGVLAAWGEGNCACGWVQCKEEVVDARKQSGLEVDEGCVDGAGFEGFMCERAVPSI